MTSIIIVLRLATNIDLKIEHMDVKAAFLHGNLEKKIYMKQPESFKIKGKEDYVSKLKKKLIWLEVGTETVV